MALTNRIAANYFIWHKWIEYKLNKMKRKNPFKRLLVYWEISKYRARVTNDYDCIFDKNIENEEEKEIERLENIEENLSKQKYRIKNFLINLIKKPEKNINKNKEELKSLRTWEYMLSSIIEEDEWLKNNWNKDIYEINENWIKELNLKWLLDILNDQNGKMIESLEEEEKIEKLKQKMKEG